MEDDNLQSISDNLYFEDSRMLIFENNYNDIFNIERSLDELINDIG